MKQRPEKLVSLAITEISCSIRQNSCNEREVRKISMDARFFEFAFGVSVAFIVVCSTCGLDNVPKFKLNRQRTFLNPV